MEKVKAVYVRTQFWFNLKAGGSVAHTNGVLSGMIKNGCEIKVISNEEFLGIKNFNYKIIKPLRLKPDWVGELLYNFYAGPSLKKSILKFRPDFIYHRYTGYTFFITALAKKLGIPLILEFNSFDSWKLKYWEKSNNIFKKFFQKFILFKIVKKIENYNLNNSNLIVTVSDTLMKDLLRVGFRKSKILVITNGFDQQKFNPELITNDQNKSLKKRLRIGDGKIIVGFSGTFGPWHGIPQLIEAISRITNDYCFKPIHFLIIGNGGQLLKEMKRRLSNSKKITFTGTVPYSQIQYYLNICDILVAPHCVPADGKEFFGSPTKIFEYMAMGKGIVASNLGQIGKVLKNNRTAIMVEPGNIGELVDGILKLVSDKKMCLKLGMNALKEVREKYTWDRNIRKLLTFMDENKILS